MPNSIIEALFHVNLSAHQARVIFFIMRKTFGFQKDVDRISGSQFSETLGLDRRTIHRALTHLKNAQIVVIQRDDKSHVRYGIQKDFKKWNPSFLRRIVIQRDDKNGVSSEFKNVSKDKRKSPLVIQRDDRCHPTDRTQKKLNKRNNLYAQNFERFWDIWPKKIDKQAAGKAWKKLSPSEELIEIIISDIKRRSMSDNWTKDNRQFCPYPAKYLNARRWEDEIKPAANQSRGSNVAKYF